MAVTVTGISDLDPCPRVEVTAEAVAGAATVTIIRKWDEGTEIVRDARRRAMGSPTFVVDYAPPLDTQTTYVATYYSALGAVVATATSAPVTVQWPTLDELAIIQAPLAPKTAMPVLLYGSAVESLSYSRDLTYALPLNTRDRVAVGGAMRDAEDVPLSIYARTGDETRSLLALITGYMPLLVRSVDPIELPRVCYASIKTTRRVPIHREVDGWTGFEIAIDQVRAPAASIAAPIFTYSAVKEMYAGQTYGQVKATRPGASYLDWKRDPRP